jgi:hypothetical protein
MEWPTFPGEKVSRRLILFIGHHIFNNIGFDRKVGQTIFAEIGMPHEATIRAVL